MNYGRIAVAAVVATVVDFVYGFIVYGNLLTNQFSWYPNVYRSPSGLLHHMPLMAAGFLVAMFVAVLIYSKGYEGGDGLGEGSRFGALMGLFVMFYGVVSTYSTTNIGKRLTVYLAIAGVAEWIIVGAAIGMTYKPGASASRRGAGV